VSAIRNDADRATPGPQVKDQVKADAIPLRGSGWAARVASLFAAHRARLETLLARRLGQRDQARDIVQESFARLYAAGSSGSLDDDTRRLYAIARNAGIDSSRAQRRRAEALGSLAPEQIQREASSPHDSVVARETLAALDRILGTLPERTRDVFLLRRVHGLAHAEIARALGISVSTVEKHLLRAIRACQPLKDALARRESLDAAPGGPGVAP
jgi:RNA polymerase sigma factor (sigma-70 family)